MYEPWMVEKWEAVDFPLVNASMGQWHNRNATLSGLKELLQRENLNMYKDYVIVVNPEYRDYRVITVKFKEEGQGLLVLLHWMSSNYYKERA